MAKKYTPEDGLRNTIVFPTDPADEAAAREQIQGMFDQILDFHNAHLADIAAHGYRKNLLHNWDFRNPVNQRGLTSVATSFQNAYTLDRWKLMHIGTVAINSGYITVAGTGSFTPSLRQIVETERIHLAGKTVTFSAYVRGSCKVGIGGTYGNNHVNLTDWTLVKRTVTLTAEGDIVVDISALDVNGSFDVLCAKLELGSESTLANDPPADYGEQLALCQRYCVVYGGASGYIGIGNAFSATDVYMLINLPCSMRALPSISYSGSPTLRTGATDLAITGLSTWGGVNGNCITLKADVSGATVGEKYMFVVSSSVKIILSADL